MARWLFRRRFAFREVPGPGVTPRSDRPGMWCSPSGAPWFGLIPENGEFPSGWVLVEARIIRRGKDYNARLRLDLGEGFDRGVLIEPPISAKGTLREIVRLPEGICGIRWEPMQAPGEFEQSAIRMTEIGGPERVWRMGRRVLALWFKQPRQRRKRVGITLWRMFRNLPEAYRSAGLFRRYAPSFPYGQWLQRYHSLSYKDRLLIRRHIRRFKDFPFIYILIPVVETREEALQATLHSLNGQLYRQFSVTLLDVGGTMGPGGRFRPLGDWEFLLEYVEETDVAHFLFRLNESLATEWAKDYLMVVPAGDGLSEHAFYWVAAELQDHPQATLIYTDEDEVKAGGEPAAPRFKPDWSPEHLRSTNYVGRAAVLRCRDVHSAGGLQEDDCFGSGLDLLLRMSEIVAPDSVRHVPQVLYHRRHHPDAGGTEASRTADADRRALVAHLARTGVKADVELVIPGCFRLRYALPEHPPRVSIMIPTRDGMILLRRCVESVLMKSTYPDFELLLVDNQSIEADTLAYLKDLEKRPQVRVLRYDQPFNFSAINNFAARHARGDVLCLLNNDTEVISPHWMEEMVGRLTQTGVGVVGAKLYYPNDLVQHAGDAVGSGGCADHLHSMLERNAPGYCCRAAIAQEFSAVTAACLMTWKHLYERLGGLDEVSLQVAFNDVDYCLRVQELGYRVVWTPHAELYHHESASRGQDDSIEKRKRTRREADIMRWRWKKRIEHDLYYNPNLNYERADFPLSNVPRDRRPWKRHG